MLRLPALRRAVALLLLVAQAAIATGAVWEPHPTRRVDTHTEPAGTRDVAPHHDDACPICALWAAAAAPAEPLPLVDVRGTTELPRATVVGRSARLTAALRSRAPPALPA
jgi:hypothetical protein